MGTRQEQVLTDRSLCRQFICTVKLPEFMHSHLAFHVADEYNVKRHIFQEFMKLTESSSSVALSQGRRVNKRYCHLKKRKKKRQWLVW